MPLIVALGGGTGLALIDCPECGRQISNRAPACIGCGFPLSELNTPSSAPEVEASPPPGPAEPAQMPSPGDNHLEVDPMGDDPLAAVASTGAKHRTLTPGDPIGAAQRAHEERMTVAKDLHAEGRYTDQQRIRFRIASEAERDRDIAVAKSSE